MAPNQNITSIKIRVLVVPQSFIFNCLLKLANKTKNISRFIKFNNNKSKKNQKLLLSLLIIFLNSVTEKKYLNDLEKVELLV